MVFNEYVIVGQERDHLIRFVNGYEAYLKHVLGIEPFQGFPLSPMDGQLTDLLNENARDEITESFSTLLRDLDNTTEGNLKKHGLIGPQLEFKLATVLAIEIKLMQNHENRDEMLRYSEILGDVATTILDSALEESSAGTAVKELGSIGGKVASKGF